MRALAMLPRVPVLARHEGRARDASACAAKLRRWAQRMLRVLERDDAELSLLLCGDATMRALNREHRGKDRTTDVLAFAMAEGKPLVSVHDTLGDVVISWHTARRQARSNGVSVEREVCLLLAHGLLHLLGYDHRTRRQERRMSARAHVLVAAALGAASERGKARSPSAARGEKSRRTGGGHAR